MRETQVSKRPLLDMPIPMPMPFSGLTLSGQMPEWSSRDDVVSPKAPDQEPWGWLYYL